MVRVLSYNCAQGKYDLKKLSVVILKSKPDVICLQEVNARVEPFLKFKGYIRTDAPGRQGWFSCVTFSKKPPCEVKCITLPKQKRQALGILLKSGWVFNVHLASGRDAVKTRSSQLTKLLKSLPTGPEGKVVIVGDFNLAVDEGRWNSRLDRNQFSAAPLVPTYCSSNLVCKDKRTFDHPFDRCISRGMTCRKTQVIGQKTRISDHFGVCWTLK